jgi:hypothetical protein
LNQLFFADTEKSKFFLIAKKKNMDLLDELDVDKMAMREYIENCQQNMVVAEPFFITFEANIMYLCKKIVNIIQAKAINRYLYTVRQLDNKKIFKLAIDQCQMKDDVFAEFLQGCFK